MNIDIAFSQTPNYSVETPIFEGPLDLLLQLIERAELDITRLALAQVTDQYLAYIASLENLIAEEVSAFLVIAAKLLQIKSEALLPRPPVREPGEDDPGEALARQLQVYKQFKVIAEDLSSREDSGLRSYLRLAAPPKVESRLDLSTIGLKELLEAARQIFENIDQRQELRTVVAPSPVTIREKISQLIRKLHQTGKVTFGAFVRGVHSRVEIVVTFLAMLELIKRQKISAAQDTLFGEILLEPIADLDEDETFELEFGE